MNLCAVLTHNICVQYMASCNRCHPRGRTTDMYNHGSCSVRANGRGRQVEGRKRAVTESRREQTPLHLHRLNMTQAELQYRSEPEGFGRIPVSGRHYTRVLSTLMPNQPCCTPGVSYGFSVFSSEFLYADFPCSLNSFSIFGLYISARLQIIWRPHLWLV